MRHVFVEVPRVDELRFTKYFGLNSKFERQTKSKAAKLLQMPPYMLETPDEPQVLSRNPELDSYSENKYLFIDISITKDPAVSPEDLYRTLRKCARL